jgi:hypothetical protein
VIIDNKRTLLKNEIMEISKLISKAMQPISLELPSSLSKSEYFNDIKIYSKVSSLKVNYSKIKGKEGHEIADLIASNNK